MVPRVTVHPSTCEIRKATASNSRDRQLTGSDPPPVSIADLAITCFSMQLLVGAILVIGEATGRFRLPYGKFRTSVGINSRAGLALAYTTPVFVYIVLWVEGGSPRTLYHLVVFGAFLFHFLRRIFEVSFVNSYSRPTLCALL